MWARQWPGGPCRAGGGPSPGAGRGRAAGATACAGRCDLCRAGSPRPATRAAAARRAGPSRRWPGLALGFLGARVQGQATPAATVPQLCQSVCIRLPSVLMAIRRSCLKDTVSSRLAPLVARRGWPWWRRWAGHQAQAGAAGGIRAQHHLRHGQYLPRARVQLACRLILALATALSP